jgi:hypothetical protein
MDRPGGLSHWGLFHWGVENYGGGEVGEKVGIGLVELEDGGEIFDGAA